MGQSRENLKIVNIHNYVRIVFASKMILSSWYSEIVINLSIISWKLLYQFGCLLHTEIVNCFVYIWSIIHDKIWMQKTKRTQSNQNSIIHKHNLWPRTNTKNKLQKVFPKKTDSQEPLGDISYRFHFIAEFLEFVVSLWYLFNTYSYYRFERFNVKVNPIRCPEKQCSC